MLPELGDNLFRILGFTAFHAFQVANEDFLQTPAHDGMIVGKEHPDHTTCCRSREANKGMHTLTRVPRFGAPLIRNLPPSSKTRSRIPKMPSDSLAESCSSVTPISPCLNHHF